MKNYIIILLFFVGCTKSSAPEVRVAGSLHAIMMENKTEATINLCALKDEEHLYALGSVERLDGEVLVIDNEPIVTKVVADTFSITKDFDTKAALLVYTNVEAWRSQTLEAIQSMKDLESILKKIAEENQLTVPLPFMIKAKVTKLNWHIVNGNPGSNASPEDHSASGYRNELKDSDVEILGFYSEEHQGIFTHRGQNSHLHFRSKDGSQAGHVDDLLIKNESLLFIPKSY